METRIHTTKADYFFISIYPGSTVKLLASNNERAFIISQLQDILSARSLLEDPGALYRLASHIDLLAYSILTNSIQLVVFSISRESAQILCDLLTNRLRQYQSEWRKNKIGNTQPLVFVRRLVGPHEALSLSTQIHLNHSDWEFDRYSSIGFYLHDRRGDWMRIWRLTQLYENTQSNYRQLLDGSTQHLHATSTHE